MIWCRGAMDAVCAWPESGLLTSGRTADCGVRSTPPLPLTLAPAHHQSRQAGEGQFGGVDARYRPWRRRSSRHWSRITPPEIRSRPNIRKRRDRCSWHSLPRRSSAATIVAFFDAVPRAIKLPVERLGPEARQSDSLPQERADIVVQREDRRVRLQLFAWSGARD